MKIGILTYHWVANFGAQMQTFASVQRLKAMGFEPVVLNWVPADAEKRYGAQIDPGQLEQHRLFAERHFSLSPLCRTLPEVHRMAAEMDLKAILVGSDSLFNLVKPRFNWKRFRKLRPTSDHRFPNPFWMPCGEEADIPHAALSVSSQNSDYLWFKRQKPQIGMALKRFRYVSVRDQWTSGLVHYFTDGALTPPVTPDPVFSMDSDAPCFPSKEELARKFGLPDHYILLSFFGGTRSRLSEAWQREFIALAHAHGRACVEFPRAQGCQRLSTELRIPLPLSPLDWYSLIRHADGYVGMLMHPLIVALRNAVPCFSFDHYGRASWGGLATERRSSKIYLLLDELDLTHLHCSVSDVFGRPSARAVWDALSGFDVPAVKRKMESRAERCRKNYADALRACGMQLG